MTASKAADAAATMVSCTAPVVNLSEAEAAAWRAWRAPIVVVDYHKGNLSSVIQGLSHAGAVGVSSSDDVGAIRGAAGVVLPGVGSFFDAIDFMARERRGGGGGRRDSRRGALLRCLPRPAAAL